MTLLTFCAVHASNSTIASKFHTLEDKINNIPQKTTQQLQETINDLNKELNTLEQECKKYEGIYAFRKNQISSLRQKINDLGGSTKKNRKNKNTDASKKQKNIYNINDLTPPNPGIKKDDFWENLSKLVLIGSVILVIIGIVQFLYSTFTSHPHSQKPKTKEDHHANSYQDSLPKNNLPPTKQ